MLESLVMISSVVPSLKYSFWGSPLRFWNGRTATEGLAASADAAGTARARYQRNPAYPLAASTAATTRIARRAAARGFSGDWLTADVWLDSARRRRFKSARSSAADW